ncbi:Myosin-10 like [Actinidia chinensis var. chinensis]|uniref:Myosin-10 like n=1 Tax=Actinidia chinensis var. chinensis TaxID=1590841 RepID=A0A2R6RY93_ACTCC|nr:Myosin-10 like [Actinidia chinensis var. chinensis]
MGGAAPIALTLSQGEPRRGDPSSDNSIEYLGTIRKRMRKILPLLLDLTLLRLLGEKKCPREASNTSPSKKGKSSSVAKDKGAMSPMVTQKKAIWKFVEQPSKEVASKVAIGEGTSANPVVALRLKVTTLRIVPGSSLANRSWIMRDELTLQQGCSASFEGEMTCAQNSTAELDKQMSELKVQKQKATEELARVRGYQEAIAEKLAKLEMVVADLRDGEARSKKLAVEEFKSSDEFQDAVEMTTSSIVLEGMGIDQDLIEEEEDEMEKEKEKKKGEKKGDTFSP